MEERKLRKQETIERTREIIPIIVAQLLEASNGCPQLGQNRASSSTSFPQNSQNFIENLARDRALKPKGQRYQMK